jgi:hypothetical protein
VDTDNWVEKQKNFDAAINADQAECQAMLDGLASIEAGLQDEKISGTIDDMIVQKGNSWSERQAVVENLSGPLAEEIDRRVVLMKDAYPFEVIKGSLSYQPSKTGVYEYCLAAARNPKGAHEGRPRASAIFEWIARDVLTLHLGTGALGFRTGWPPYEFESRGVRAKQTLEALNAKTSEFRWAPEHNHPQDPEPKDLKDVGLDVVAWKPWPDGRLGQLFAIGQCACGKNDIGRKGQELSLERLKTWLRPVCYAPPLRCFLLAHHIPNTIELQDLSKEAGLVFDRARLVMLAESNPEAVKSREGIDYHAMAEFYATQRAA